MSLATCLFAVVATLTAVSALGVVLARNIVRMVVWLLFTLVGVSLLYFLLGAEFLGTVQLIVYVGGTLVLFSFGVMLTAQGPLRELRTSPAELVVAVTLGLALFALLAVVSLRLADPPTINPHAPPAVAELGLALLGVTEVNAGGTVSGVRAAAPPPRTPVAYLLPFEIVSVHLLVVLVGAAYLARPKQRVTS